jgi:hypothetical protein
LVKKITLVYSNFKPLALRTNVLRGNSKNKRLKSLPPTFDLFLG